jgi:hypothetical protein
MTDDDQDYTLKLHPCDCPALSEQLIQDLWGIGFTIVPRTPIPDLWDAAAGKAPAGMSYQWNADPKQAGWKCVPAYRHPGLFAPYVYRDDIEVGGLWLMERPKAEVEAEQQAAHAKAQRNVDDWLARQGAAGFTGGVTVLSEGSNQTNQASVREIGVKSIEDVTKIPPDLYGRLGEIFAERDRLWECSDEWWGKTNPTYHRYVEIADKHPDWTRGQVMNAVLTPIAIENIRTRLATEGAQHDQSTDSSSGGGASDAPQAGASPEGQA